MKSRITVLYGDNSFEKLRELSRLKKDFENKGFTIENINSENIEEDQFISIISGASLFHSLIGYLQIIIFVLLKILSISVAKYIKNYLI